ncbi:MAG: Hsp70 family protein [Maritimibacter sp.]
MTDKRATLAIDFGTSNSAAAILAGGNVHRVPLEDWEETLPTAVFFPEGGGAMKIGAAAGAALIGGDEGRYMRALKSVLGTSLFHEERLIAGKRRTLASIVTAFLVEVKSRAEALTRQSYSSAVSGRPVHFHTADPERDAKAAEDLAACYHAAGFTDLRFVLEPEAAALASHGKGRAGELGLIVDIGGGTSDFTIYRHGEAGVDILSSHGIRLGGTDFDQAISLAHAMPLLGHGGELKREFGPGLLPMPNALYVDLATWARIPFCYTPDTRRSVADMLKRAVDPVALGYLAELLEHELGHELAFAVEKGKIAANGGDAMGRINMAMIAPGLGAALTPDDMAQALAQHAAKLTDAITETLSRADVTPDSIGTVVLVGGSSLMGLVEAVARRHCPTAEIERGEAFTAIVDGLALAIDRPIGTSVPA